MRKIEYLHLHGLLVELRRYLQETGDVPPGAFATYDEYGVTPTSIHRQKDRHHEALSRLRDGIHLTIEARYKTTTDAPATADPTTVSSLSE